jgi:hypothetical protein
MNSSEKRNDRPIEREAQIAAYFDGEMTPEQAAAFESRMQTDEALRREVEQWREALEAVGEWMAMDAPGVERVATLAIPSVAGKQYADDTAKRVVFPRKEPVWLFRFRPLAWGSLAAAVIFVAGFYVGQMTHGGAVPLPGDRADSQAFQNEVKPTPTPSERQPSERGQIEAAGVPVQRYTDELGRLVVETTLQGSGARALWVVDGKFQLAQSLQNR